MSDCTGRGPCQQTIWAAVEVSGRLSRIPSSRSPSGNQSPTTGSFVPHQLDRFFEFGCLYDLSVEVSPTPGSTVIQVIQEQAFPTTIYAGSSVLLLVHIQVDAETRKRPGRSGHVRQQSDELMEDLELQLGSSVAGYMQVRVSYSHSAFPEHATPEADTGGVLSLRSRLETTATASLRRRDVLSASSIKGLILEQGSRPLASKTLHGTIGGDGQSAGAEATTARSPQAHAPPGRASLQTDDGAAKAATMGAALGRRVQPGHSPQQAWASQSLRSGRGSDGPRTQAEVPTGGDGAEAGPGTTNAGSEASPMHERARPRVETHRGRAARRAPAGPGRAGGGSRRGRQEKSDAAAPAKEATGFWNWGLWF
ncbi:hypothetical protein CDD83_8746 [Cordyceps sp. RAO-2017]|nr:hypothetical protein CDD83_8746 [Cordyceps sp. RAO-2017]